MTTHALTLPYLRVSPLYLPRRDMVVAASDSLSLAVTIIESDAPDAILADLATGPAFPDFIFIVWRDSYQRIWDYGLGPIPGGVLSEVVGVISETLPGAVVFTVPASAMAAWPVRCGWCIRMNHDTTQSETLVAGSLHVRGAGGDFRNFVLDSGSLGVLA